MKRQARVAAAMIYGLLGLAGGCSKAPRPATNTSSMEESPIPPKPAAAAVPERRHKRSPERGPASVAPPSEEELLAASLAKLRKGRLAYSPPPKMKMGDTPRITARIGSESISTETLTAGLGQPGQAVDVVATPVSTRMKMTLTSSDFDIKALSSEEQFVDDQTPTEWSWDVQPKHPGKLSLHLAAVVEVGSLSKDYATVDREITVQVNPLGALAGFSNANWQKALYAILAALVAAGWKWLLDRKKKSADAGAAKP